MTEENREKNPKMMGNNNNLDTVNGQKEGEAQAQNQFPENKKKEKHLFRQGEINNPYGRKGNPNKAFSLKTDLIKSLKRIRRENPKLFQEIIDSYWKDAKHRQFLFEQVDGRATQQSKIIGDAENPVRVLEISIAKE